MAALPNTIVEALIKANFVTLFFLDLHSRITYTVLNLLKFIRFLNYFHDQIISN